MFVIGGDGPRAEFTDESMHELEEAASGRRRARPRDIGRRVRGKPDRPWELGAAIATAKVQPRSGRISSTRAEGPALIIVPGSVGTWPDVLQADRGVWRRSHRIVSISYPALPTTTRLADEALRATAGSSRAARCQYSGLRRPGIWAQFFALRHPDGSTICSCKISQPGRTVATRRRSGLDRRTTRPSASDLAEPCPQAPTANRSDPVCHALGTASALTDPEVGRGRGCRDALPAPRFLHEHITVIDGDDDPIIPPWSRRQSEITTPRASGHPENRWRRSAHLDPQAYDVVITGRLAINRRWTNAAN